MNQFLINYFFRSEDGQTLTEVGLIILLVVIAVIFSLTTFGNSLLALFQNFVGAF